MKVDQTIDAPYHSAREARSDDPQPIREHRRIEEYAHWPVQRVGDPERPDGRTTQGRRFQSRACSTDYPAGFYVYRLIDPRTSVPFYVGKGQRGRAWEHQRAVERGRSTKNTRKDALIREILAAGANVEVEIVACYLRESDALNHEFRLVDASPSLTNVMPGGGGGSLSDQETARRIAARRLRLKRLRERERIQAEREEREANLNAYLAKARSPAERAKVAAWLATLSPADAAKVLTPVAVGAAIRAKAFEPKPPPFQALKHTTRRRQFGRRGKGPAEINPADYVIK